MHVLTKIFIVLVTLLAIFLVPLIVVYAYNDDAFKARYQSAQAEAQAARDALASTESRHGAVESRLDRQLHEARSEVRNLERSRNEALQQVAQLESRLAASEALKADIQSELQKLVANIESGTELTNSLVGELRTLRQEAMACERQNVELDEALRDTTSQLEVAMAAQRALQEELQRMAEENAAAMNQISQYVARFGAIADDRREDEGVVPDRTLTTTVTRVRRSADQVLVEIGAGSRDGVQEGWTMTIGRGSMFLANVRIIEVDVNRSTGRVVLEDEGRGLVDVGDIVQSWAGMD
ncbi:MAG: hypothetical protein EA377_10225 [Phycisphaerales bacterium]|nr:MAG: hypothetical protein EA377_10225 [Phycisphaerales bacterium]